VRSLDLCKNFFTGLKIALLKYTAVIASSVVQFRVMGGAVGLAVVTCVANTYIKSHLVGLLTDTEIVAVFESLATISKLPLHVQEIVRSIFARGFILQMKILIGFGVVQFPAVALMWQKDGHQSDLKA